MSHYHDRGDRIEAVDTKKRTPAYFLEDYQLEKPSKASLDKEIRNQRIYTAALMGLGALALLGACALPPIGMLTVAIVVGVVLLAALLLLFYSEMKRWKSERKSEIHLIEMKEMTNSVSTTEDWEKGSSQGKHPPRNEKNGPVDVIAKTETIIINSTIMI